MTGQGAALMDASPQLVEPDADAWSTTRPTTAGRGERLMRVLPAPLEIKRVSPDYSWMEVWRISGVDHSRALTGEYSYHGAARGSGGLSLGTSKATKVIDSWPRRWQP